MAKEVINEDTATRRTNTVAVSRNWLYGLVGLLVLAIVFMAGVGIANHRGFNNVGPGKRFGMAMGPRRNGIFRQGIGASQGNRISGVVTSVNGGDFTIAGNGSTTNVTTSSSTQYQNGNSVKQNDTVVVFGTTTNGTITATEVAINP